MESTQLDCMLTLIKNEKLDTNFFGIPKEQFGFSNNAKGRFGPPSFESASFELDGVQRNFH